MQARNVDGYCDTNRKDNCNEALVNDIDPRGECDGLWV